MAYFSCSRFKAQSYSTLSTNVSQVLLYFDKNLVFQLIVIFSFRYLSTSLSSSTRRQPPPPPPATTSHQSRRTGLENIVLNGDHSGKYSPFRSLDAQYGVNGLQLSEWDPHKFTGYVIFENSCNQNDGVSCNRIFVCFSEINLMDLLCCEGDIHQNRLRLVLTIIVVFMVLKTRVL